MCDSSSYLEPILDKKLETLLSVPFFSYFPFFLVFLFLELLG